MTGSPNDESESGNNNWQPVVQTHYDHEGRHDLTTTIILAIAEAEDIPPTAIKSPVLMETIDVPALEAVLFGPCSDDAGDGEPKSITFRYRDYQVCVQADGWVIVRTPLER